MIYYGKNGYLVLEDNNTKWEIENKDLIAKNRSDIENGKLIKLNKTQCDFLSIHPEANYIEVLNCKIEDSVLIEIIKKKREELYKKETDHLFIAYQKYTILGEHSKAESVKQEWLAKMDEIKKNNPYQRY